MGRWSYHSPIGLAGVSIFLLGKTLEATLQANLNLTCGRPLARGAGPDIVPAPQAKADKLRQ
jgi:hypothetical protein